MKQIHLIWEKMDIFFQSLLHPRSGLLFISFFLIASTFHQSQYTSNRASQELRIAVAKWRQEGSLSRDIQSGIYSRLLERLAPLNLENVSVIKIHESLKNAADTDQLALKYDVDVLVWGWYDEISIWGYIDLANSTNKAGLTNSLAAFLERGGSTETIRVLNVLSHFEYDQDGVFFCVPRWTP